MAASLRSSLHKKGYMVKKIILTKNLSKGSVRILTKHESSYHINILV